MLMHDISRFAVLMITRHCPRQSRHTKLLDLLVLGIASAATLASPVRALQLQQDFAGPYAPANWTFSANGGDGSVDTTGAPNSITLNGSDSQADNFINTDYTTTAAGSGPVSFDYDYFSTDSSFYDGFGYLLNGAFTQIVDNGSQDSGFSQFNVVAGDTFGFRVYTVDDAFARGTATISNFSAPVPGPVPLLGAGAAFGCSRRLRRRTSRAHGPLSSASHISDQD